MLTSEDLYADFDDEIVEEPQAGHPEEDNQIEAEPGHEENEEESAASKEPVKVKKVRNPQPKLDAETLKGKRGLLALPGYFERVKYKGHGHEEEDLNVILKTYEYWCHRLFPKYPFDDCIDKIDKLGWKKKAVQTFKKKIRLDMAKEDEPIINDDVDSDNDNDSLLGRIDNQFDDLLGAPQIPQEQAPPIELTEEQAERIRLNKERAEKLRQERLQRIRENSQANSNSDDEDIDNVLSQIRSLKEQASSMELTEEQAERIRQNKERAEKLRQEKLKFRENSQASLGESSQNTVQDHSSSGEDDIDGVLNKINNVEHTEISQSQNSESENVDVRHTEISQSQVSQSMYDNLDQNEVTEPENTTSSQTQKKRGLESLQNDEIAEDSSEAHESDNV